MKLVLKLKPLKNSTISRGTKINPKIKCLKFYGKNDKCGIDKSFGKILTLTIFLTSEVR